MKSILPAIVIFAGANLFAQSALNEVDFTNSPKSFAGKEYTVMMTFNPFESSVSRMDTQSSRHYGGLLVSSIDGEKWESTHLYFNKTDSAIIKKFNQLLKDQNIMEPPSFKVRVKYLGKFGDFMGGTHGFELVELLE